MTITITIANIIPLFKAQIGIYDELLCLYFLYYMKVV